MERPIVVIAEDELFVRMALAYELRGAYEVIEAENGAKAIQSLDTYRDRIYAIITDIHMPDVDGWGVLASVVEHHVPCRLGVMSAEAVQHDPRWQHYPQARFFPKPANPAAIKAWLAQQ